MAAWAGETEDGLHYRVKADGTLSVGGYSGDSEALVIPSEIDGRKVTSVGNFENNKVIRRIVIPEGVEYLEVWAFASCANLEAVSLPDTVQCIEKMAFYECANLKEISLPEGITELEKETFRGCRRLAEINIPSTMRTIGRNVFWGCPLKSLDLPEGLVSIGGRAFYECDMTSVTVPEGVTVIEEGVFAYCEELEEVRLHPQIESIGEEAFTSCRKLKEIEIPPKVESIGVEAFSGCGSLRRVTVPGNVKAMEKYCFARCESLEEAVIEEGVLKIGEGAFIKSIALRKVILPDSVREIGIRTFTEWLDAPMEDVVLYANPGSYAREYAASNGLRHSCIRHAALVRDAAVAATCGTAGKTEGSHCPECGVVVLEQREVAPTGLHSWDGGTVTVRPTTVTTGIMKYACRVCGAGRYVTLPQEGAPPVGGGHEEGEPPREAPEVGEVKRDGRGLVYRVTRSGAKGVELEVTGTRGAKGVLRIPASVSVKGTDCKVTSIGKGAFKGNKKLRSLTAGASVRRINAGAFSGCRSLKEVIIRSKALSYVGRNAFQGIHPKARIKVPPKKLKEYRARLKGKGQRATVKVVK